MTTDIHAAFEAKYKASAQDPAVAEELRVFTGGFTDGFTAGTEVGAANLRRVRDVRNDSAEEWRTEVRLCRQTIADRDAEIAALREVLTNARQALQEANEAGAGGPIQDTIWMPARISSAETLFDYLDAAIGQTPPKPPPIYPSTEGQRIARQIREGKEKK